MATMAAYIADNGQCCATNAATISNVQKDITSAEESVSSICSSVIFFYFNEVSKSKHLNIYQLFELYMYIYIRYLRFQVKALANVRLDRTNRGDFDASNPTSNEVVSRFNLIENAINRFTTPNCT